MQGSNSDLESRVTSRKCVDNLVNSFTTGLHDLGIHDAALKIKGERSIHELRKSTDRRDKDNVSVLTLKETDGVLRWEHGSGFQPPARKGRRSRQRSRPFEGSIVKQFKFENLVPNQVDDKLRSLDSSLNNHQGFWELDKDDVSGHWKRAKQIDSPVGSGNLLLIIHGTFSNTDNNLSAFNETPFGVKFLDDASKKYKQIVAFSHPTIGMSPFTNAVTLSSFLRNSTANIDVICHSRGGLIARWWNEVIESHSRRKVRVAFMGSTLGGTSLASPYQLKSALNLLTNISRGVTVAAKTGSAIFPAASGFMMAALGINRIFTNIIGVFRNTPILDAGVALVPGLNGQSRQGGNSEILVLRENFVKQSRQAQNDLLRSYRFLAADFEPVSNHSWWQFWKYFNKARIANFAADRIFPHQNDLVVDTASMNELCDTQDLTDTQRKLVGKQTYQFQSNSGIHHLNYLSSQVTIRQFRELFR